MDKKLIHWSVYEFQCCATRAHTAHARWMSEILGIKLGFILSYRMHGKQNLLCVLQEQILVLLQALELGRYRLHKNKTCVIEVYPDATNQDEN